MALHGNRSVLHKSPVRFINGREALLRDNFNKYGMVRNAYDAKSPTAGIPYGHLSPSAWVLPRIGGAMSSQNVTILTIGVSGLAVGGVTANADTGFSFTVADAAGQLISSGNGTASFTISTLPLLLTASLNGIGSTSFTISTNAPLLGAEAGAVGTASFAITGTLTPYAIGSMSGSTVDNTVLTVDAIAAGILAAALTSPIASDVRRVNTYTVTGDGKPGTEWGAA